MMNSGDQDRSATRPRGGTYKDIGDEVDLIDYLAVIVRRRRLVVWLMVAGLGAGILSALLAGPPPYRAEVNLLAVEPRPVSGGQESTINTSVLQSFAMGRFVLGASIPNPKAPPDSTSVREYLGLDLSVRQALDALNEKTELFHVDVGLVSISVTDADSAVAAGIANAYVGALRHYFMRDRIERAEEELAFIGSRLVEVERELRTAEDSLLAFRLRNRENANTDQLLLLQRELGWRQRRVTTWENVYNNLMARQEGIRIEAQRGMPEFRVLGYAVAEDAEVTGLGKRSRALVGLGGGMLLGVLGAFLADFLQRLRHDDRLRRTSHA